MKSNNKRNKTIYSNQKGITLIALVITIVVLLILAGVSINAIFSENGIINKAKDAQNKMDQATQNDLDAIEDLSNWLDSKTNGATSEGTTIKSYEETEKDASKNGVLKENAIYTDNENATATIPKGFKVSNVAATESTEGEQTISTGLVIQDAEGNEFVWIPVNYTETKTDANNNGLDDGFEATFKRTNTDDTEYSEPFEYEGEEGYPEEKEDYIKMMKSVQANKGFYIGRYEAGTTTPRTSSTTASSTVVVKRDAYPYIYVGWGNEMNDIETEIDGSGNGAVYLSKHMYDGKVIGATSTLCYGVQWDAIMNFVSDTNHDVDTDSTSWGNYYDNSWTIDREKASYSEDDGESYTPIGSNAKSKTDSESILLTTGASDSFKAKNIFNLAGNVYEWTMEAVLSTYRVSRGGNYDKLGSDYPASYRNNYFPSDSNNYLGFRPALYL